MKCVIKCKKLTKKFQKKDCLLEASIQQKPLLFILYNVDCLELNVLTDICFKA